MVPNDHWRKLPGPTAMRKKCLPDPSAGDDVGRKRLWAVWFLTAAQPKKKVQVWQYLTATVVGVFGPKIRPPAEPKSPPARVDPQHLAQGGQLVQLAPAG